MFIKNNFLLSNLHINANIIYVFLYKIGICDSNFWNTLYLKNNAIQFCQHVKLLSLWCVLTNKSQKPDLAKVLK